MEIKEIKEGEITILVLIGKLNTLSSGALDQKLRDLTDNNFNRLVIDFSDLDFISSSGLRVLLTTGKKVKSNQGKLALSALQEHVKDVFDVAGFTMLFNIFATQDEAVKNVSE